MKLLLIVLAVVFLFLQYKLWIAHDGVLETYRLKKVIAAQRHTNEKLANKNRRLVADVQALKKGSQATELLAREEIGMIKQGETYYQVVAREENNSKEKK